MEGEIVGLLQSNNGRSCEIHDACGKSLKVGEMVVFQSTLVEINGATETAIKAVVIRDGRESCTVGFLSRRVAHGLVGIDCLGKRGRILSLCLESCDSAVRSHGYHQQGVAVFKIMNGSM